MDVNTYNNLVSSVKAAYDLPTNALKFQAVKAYCEYCANPRNESFIPKTLLCAGQANEEFLRELTQTYNRSLVTNQTKEN